jgi:trypsin-like peptidase
MTDGEDPSTSEPVAPIHFGPPAAPLGTFAPPLPPGAAPALSVPPPPPAPMPPTRGRRGWWIGGALGALAALALAAGAVVVVTGGDDAASGGGPCPDADGRSGDLRRCVGPSLAFVATEFGVGSGVLIDGGYVVTKVHVVDPFGAADLTFTDGERHEDVPVVGIDAFTDIAVLGPIDTDRAAMTIETQPFDEDDDEPDVFLIGFPGGVEDDEPAITIAGGLLSRTRRDDTLGLTYLQSDAAISGGQSGGALVDGSGRFLGISGLSFAEEFALVLSAGDVRTSVDRVLAGDGDTYASLDRGSDHSDETPLTLTLTATSPTVTMVLAPGSTRRDIQVTAAADARIGVEVSSASGSVWAVNDDLRDSEAFYEDAAELESVGSGRYTFELAGDDYGFVYVSRLDEDAEVTLHADVPFVAHADVAEGDAIADGETRGVLQAFAPTVVHEVELEAGDVVEIALSAGSSDPYFTLLAPGEEYDVEAEPQVDDGGGGLYDLDSYERFEIDESGRWRIVLSTWDGYTSGYVLTVTIS